MLIGCENITKRYGPKLLFEGLNWSIVNGRRIGLIGPNGCGKTTLFRIFCDEEDFDEGKVTRTRNVSVGLLPQEVNFSGTGTILEQTISAESEVDELHEQIAATEIELDAATGNDSLEEDLAKRLALLHERLENIGGYDRDVRAKKILAGLGFAESDYDRPLHEFSGGWQMRVALARLLLTRPSLLLLDEPTNHLDLPSLEWLESWLADYEGTFVAISHDSYFLDKMTNEICELGVGGIISYKGNYSDYLIHKAERDRLLVDAAERQGREIERIQKFINRFRAKASKAKQVQNRIKQLEKIEPIRLPDHAKKISFSFAQPPRSGVRVLEFAELHKSYGDLKIYTGVDMLLERGDRAALVGPNGAGKSTLLKIMAGVLDFERGDKIIGHNVSHQYYAQMTVDSLDFTRSVYDELSSVAPTESQTRLRTLLGSFLFRGDDVFKQVSVLSGGEKSRLALAKILLRPANLLLLDEPTNHLDSYSTEVLIDALSQFTGTICLISHDRQFINRIATKTIEVGEGQLTSYIGNYKDYMRQKHSAKNIAGADEWQQKQIVTEPNSSLSRKEAKRVEAQRRNEIYKKKQKIEKKIKSAELIIIESENKLQAIYDNLSDSSTYRDEQKAQRLSAEREGLEQKLSDANDDWERLTEQHDRLENADRGNEE
jgi:ATP-binding cassette, subfamily F, member 3